MINKKELLILISIKKILNVKDLYLFIFFFKIFISNNIMVIMNINFLLYHSLLNKENTHKMRKNKCLFYFIFLFYFLFIPYLYFLFLIKIFGFMFKVKKFFSMILTHNKKKIFLNFILNWLLTLYFGINFWIDINFV